MDNDDNGILTDNEEINHTEINAIGLDNISLFQDCSAINYYVESYVFTQWYKDNINPKLTTENNKLIISNTNNPEDAKSDFNQYKAEKMENIINEELNKAITNYSNRMGGTYKLPKLSATQWEQVFKNVSIISFFQGVPSGTKIYNGYAIATSTNNKEYVDPNQIYMISPSSMTDYFYHRPDCSEIDNTLIETLPNRRNKKYLYRI